MRGSFQEQSMNSNSQPTPGSAAEGLPWLELVGKQVASLRFGVVQIVVHDSRVVQIERTEKFRLDHVERPAVPR